MSALANCSMYKYHLSLITIAIIIVTHSTKFSKYIHCYTSRGTDPSSPQYKSIATCNSSYAITCCGADREGSTYDSSVTNDGFYGSWIIPQKGGCESEGARVFARCCNLTNYGSSITTVSKKSDTISCTSSTEVAVGCAIYDGSRGVYAGSIDQSRNATYCYTPSSSTIYVNCYDTSTMINGHALQCVSIWGTEATNSSTVSCPTHKENYFMTSCTAYTSLDHKTEVYNIENDICVAATAERLCGGWGPWGDCGTITANAICCRMTKEEILEPTAAAPTIPNPTLSPTINPSFPPTESTADPTFYPTLNPLLSTHSPTKDPSLFPSVIMFTSTTFDDPSPNPIAKPTKDPTNHPLSEFASTVVPTFAVIASTALVYTDLYTSNVLRVFFITVTIVITCCVCTLFMCCKCYKALYKDPVGYTVDSIDSSRPRLAVYPVPSMSIQNDRKPPIPDMDVNVELEASVNRTRAMSFEKRENDHDYSLQHAPGAIL